MKIKKNSILLLIMVITLCFSGCNILNQSSTQYKQVDDGYALYRYKGVSTQKTFDVPDTYENLPVTAMQSFSLANAEYLEVINVGKNVSNIDIWAMTNCPVLKEVNVDPANQHYQSVDGVLYNKEMTTLLVYPNGKTPLVQNSDGKITGGGEFTVPDTIKSISDNAFYLCFNLYSIQFNQGLESIGNKAFLKCTNLAKMTIPNTVTSLGVDSFSYCDSLTTLDIPSSVTEIGDYAFFSNSSSIEKIVIHQKDESAIKFGESWIPSKKNSVSEKVFVEYVGVSK